MCLIVATTKHSENIQRGVFWEEASGIFFFFFRGAVARPRSESSEHKHFTAVAVKL
jgi:hypothetical protein